MAVTVHLLRLSTNLTYSGTHTKVLNKDKEPNNVGHPTGTARADHENQ